MSYRMFCILVLTLLCSWPAAAKLFQNAYVSFELPPNWDCVLEGTEWVCTSKFNRRAKEAIIILTAKERGPSDSFAQYKAHLNTSRQLPKKGGGTIQSKVYHVRDRKINNQGWIDGMHLGSEVGSYYTRYLATIKDRIAILVTFSAHKTHYTKYSNDFIKAIKSLRVVASKDLLKNKPQMAMQNTSETIGAPIGSALPSDIVSEDFPEEASGGGDLSTKLLGLLLILAAIGYYLYSRGKKQKAVSQQKVRKKKKKKKKRSSGSGGTPPGGVG